MSNTNPFRQFIQAMPQLENEYLDDVFLQHYLKTFLPEKIYDKIEPDLIRFGKRVCGEIITWANDAQAQLPELITFDAWGNRVDTIKVAEGWKKLETVAAEEGLIAIGYERKEAEFSRLYQFVKLYLFTPSSAVYTCPLAMTDGAAKLIEKSDNNFLKNQVFPDLISRNAKKFKTSGQWMTERTGGSDVSRSMTIAKPEGDYFLLNGHKWFTSAITADIAFTLASTEVYEAGKRAPLSLFFLYIRDENQILNGITVEALKNKLGTKALPTAQLELKNTKAILIGEKNKGVKTISTLFNITRIYNSISAVSFIRRAFSLTSKYAALRESFGAKLNTHVLQKRTIREMEIAYRSNNLLVFYMARLLGREESGIAENYEYGLLRFLTPVTKLFTAKQSINYTSELIESFGGIGYLEDSGIPVFLRDAQVLSIWEGTTNVLSLDMLRASEKENGLASWKIFYEKLLSKAFEHNSLKEIGSLLETKINQLFQFIALQKSADDLQAVSRDVAFYVAEATIALLWIEMIYEHPDNEIYLTDLNYWIKHTMRKENLEITADMDLLNSAKSDAAFAK